MWGFGGWLTCMALLVLALVPVWIFVFFRTTVLKAKRDATLRDFRQHAFAMADVQLRWSDKVTKDTEPPQTLEARVGEEIRNRYSYQRFALPVILLSGIYAVHFLLIADLLNCRETHEASGWVFPSAIIRLAAMPMLAFCGVYVFNLGHTLRRLYMSDLTPHVFWNELQRLLLVMAIAAVLMVSFRAGDGRPPDRRWAAAFFGSAFLATPVLQGLLDQGKRMLRVRHAHAEGLPLTMVHGIGFWQQYRLEEEGIDDVQNLATLDPTELAVKTRYNLRTLVDWVDQAVLLQRVGCESMKRLREKGLISGAIDMAWASPENEGDATLVREIARLIGTQPCFVKTLMNSLYEDKHVRMLWELWQSVLEPMGKRKEK